MFTVSTSHNVSLVKTISDYSLVELQFFFMKKKLEKNFSIKSSKAVLNYPDAPNDSWPLTFDLWSLLTRLFGSGLFFNQQMYCLIKGKKNIFTFCHSTFQNLNFLKSVLLLFVCTSIRTFTECEYFVQSQWGNSALRCCSLILGSSGQPELVWTTPRNCYYWLSVVVTGPSSSSQWVKWYKRQSRVLSHPEDSVNRSAPLQLNCSAPLIVLEEVEQHLQGTTSKTQTQTPVGLVPPDPRV